MLCPSQSCRFNHPDYILTCTKCGLISDEGVYNTYVLDSDYTSWALLLHCAEKSKSPRYLSSFIMSRKPNLEINVVTYLREKLPRYDIDLSYMFPMVQNNCSATNREPGLDPDTVRTILKQSASKRRHPMKRVHLKKWSSMTAFLSNFWGFLINMLLKTAWCFKVLNNLIWLKIFNLLYCLPSYHIVQNLSERGHP